MRIETARPPRVAVIVVAAGSGTRLGAGTPKGFVGLAGRTLLERAVDAARSIGEPAHLVAVVPPDRVERARALLGCGVTTVPGGATRQASVAAGLAAVSPETEVVLVHDAARVLAPASLFERVISEVRRSGSGVVPGLPVADTIKRTDASGTVVETVDRSTLSAVQTPQGFPFARLAEAHALAAAGSDATDDAALLSAAGHPVTVIEGDPLAFKVTTRADLARAEQQLGDLMPLPAVGIGTDTHAVDPQSELWLAGLHWPGEPGLAGHSDGDAVAHAMVDALLSAAGLGDIGSRFGTSDPRFAGAHGDVFLRAVRELLESRGWRIGNVSVQFIGARPRLGARRAEAEQFLTDILGAPVSVTATTTDDVGFTGRGEGVTAIATALVVPSRARAANRLDG